VFKDHRSSLPPCSHCSTGMSFTIERVPFTMDLKDNVEIMQFFIHMVKL